MKVLYIYRNPEMGFSIGKVFKPIETEMRKYCEVDRVVLPCVNCSPMSLWKNVRVAREACKKKHYDVIHITGAVHYLLPFLREWKTVVTVHDLGFFTNNKLTLRTLLLNLLWIKTLPFASYVTFISEKTEKEVRKLVRIKEGLGATVLNPVGSEFKFFSKSINVTNPRILHLGTNPNKNLETTAIALQGMPCLLRIVGKLTDEQKEILDLYKVEYENVWDLTDEQILQEYKECDFVNFPSLYEGFGMPIIEGQAVGRPVLTSILSPMQEVAGDGAVLVDPTKPESVRKGYEELKKNPQIYVEKGLKNVKRFTLADITLQFLEIYKKIQA